MTKLLIVDPLNLVLRNTEGSIVWSSQSCFTRCLDPIPDLLCEYVNVRDPELCNRARKADGVILGGSEASAWEDTPFNDHLLDLIAICNNHEIPLLGICFGAQLLGRALGGHVARHPEGIELGAPAIRISEKGKRHFLFQGCDVNHFRSIETHRDALLTLPPDCELLASTEHSPVQAFSYRGLLTGVQFHPEMDGDDLRSLWKAFKNEGLNAELSPEQQTLLAGCDCERKEMLFVNFVDRVKQTREANLKA